MTCSPRPWLLAGRRRRVWQGSRGSGSDCTGASQHSRFRVRASSPAQVLGAVNEVMLGHALAQRFATVVVARLDLTSKRARAVLAAAGHPPPVVLTHDGSSHCPSMQGMMLGVRSGSNVLDFELELEQGSTLVLYTDGLLDAGAPRRGLTSRRAVPACSPTKLELGQQRSSSDSSDLRLSSGAGRLRDDVAIVAARVDG